MGSDGNCKYLPMLSLSYVKVCFPLVSDCTKLYSIVVNLSLVLYSSLMPVLIIVLCLVVLKACVPLFVFSYTLDVLRGICCYSIVGRSVIAFVNVVIKHYYYKQTADLWSVDPSALCTTLLFHGRRNDVSAVEPIWSTR